MIKVLAIPTNVHHIVNGTAAPKYFATRPLDLAMVQMWFFFGSIGPVHGCMSQFDGPGGIMDVRYCSIIATGLEYEHRGDRILGQTVCQHTTCGPSSHNNVVVHHVSSYFLVFWWRQVSLRAN